MNKEYLDKITLADCKDHLSLLSDNSIELFLSDIPYGICLDDWDVLHNNTNSALLGQSPAQVGKSGFKRRGKPINGWSQADRNMGKEYEEWCQSWAELLFPKLKSGSSLFVFGARRTVHRIVNAFENCGFLLKDILAWKKDSAHHRAQRVSIVFERRGLDDAAQAWNGWRLGNLAPIYEPIAWFLKPYRIGGTIADNILEHGVGAMNIEECQIHGSNPTNILEFGFRKNETRTHEAQKPLELIQFLIKLTTKEGQTVLDPFMGSGTTAVAAKQLGRHFIGFEIIPEFHANALERLDNSTRVQYSPKPNAHQSIKGFTDYLDDENQTLRDRIAELEADQSEALLAARQSGAHEAQNRVAEVVSAIKDILFSQGCPYANCIFRVESISCGVCSHSSLCALMSDAAISTGAGGEVE